MPGTLITCISDDEHFGSEVYEHLLSELEEQKKSREGKNIRVTRDLITFSAENNEIQVDEGSLVPNGMIKWILKSFLGQDQIRFKDYDVIEFGGAITIGRVLDGSKMDMHSCEICGFFTPYQEEIYTHRMTHFGI